MFDGFLGEINIAEQNLKIMLLICLTFTLNWCLELTKFSSLSVTISTCVWFCIIKL